MCELCSGGYEQTDSLPVARAAFAAQFVDPYGPMHIVVEDCNVDDENIRFCLRDKDCTVWENHFGRLMLSLSEPERVSALALSQNRYGSMPINGRR